MKSHFAEEVEDAAAFQDTATEYCWRTHRLPPASTLGNLAAIVALLIAFTTLLYLSVAPASPPGMADRFDLPPRPVWVADLPFAPRGGKVPEINMPVMDPPTGASPAAPKP